MAPSLQREIGKRRPFDDPGEEVYLNLARTAAVLGLAHDRLFKPHGLTGASYNVLRILRGHHVDGIRALTCATIIQQLVVPVPDLTRLVDRLRSLDYVHRRRDELDRRVVLVGLTDAGLAVIDALDGPLRELHATQFGALSERQRATLNRLLVAARASDGPPGG